jgi:peptidoglycan/xylan/chitin deacetylase (PgdA/CDA1 family)
MLRRLSAIGLGVTGLAGPVIALRPRLRRALVILCYHRVVPMSDPDLFPFDSDLVSATPVDFAWQMRYLRRHMSPISVETLLAALRGEGGLPPRAVLVTFDDGYDDCVQYALPVLKQQGIPAAVFVASGHIGSEETFWFDRLACHLLNTDARSIDLPEAGISERLAEERRCRREVYARIVSALKGVPNEVRIAALERIRRQCPVRHDSSTAGMSRPLSAEQLIEASRNGISVQSHTVSHPILANLDAQQLHAELAQSRAAIGNLTGVPPEMLAYPNGTWEDFGQREVDAARECGYAAAVTYEPGFQTLADLDPYRLLRLPVNWRHSRGWYKAMLAVPEVTRETRREELAASRAG